MGKGRYGRSGAMTEAGPTGGLTGRASSPVYSNERTVSPPDLDLPAVLQTNTRLKMDGREFLSLLPADSMPVAFFDPQYRGVLEKLAYGNEGVGRERRRAALTQMPEAIIIEFMQGLGRVLIPSGHLFLWVDKFHLCQGVQSWLPDTQLVIVDMLTWDKQSFGMGYRTRRRGEYCIILQKLPRRAKGVWSDHTIPDVYQEKVSRRDHTHAKPIALQGKLLAAVSNRGDCVIDPAAGSFSVMRAAIDHDRIFLGCDLNG